MGEIWASELMRRHLSSDVKLITEMLTLKEPSKIAGGGSFMFYFFFQRK